MRPRLARGPRVPGTRRSGRRGGAACGVWKLWVLGRNVAQVPSTNRTCHYTICRACRSRPFVGLLYEMGEMKMSLYE